MIINLLSGFNSSARTSPKSLSSLTIVIDSPEISGSQEWMGMKIDTEIAQNNEREEEAVSSHIPKYPLPKKMEKSTRNQRKDQLIQHHQKCRNHLKGQRKFQEYTDPHESSSQRSQDIFPAYRRQLQASMPTL